MVNLRMNKRQRFVRLKHVAQSVLLEHNIETRCQILFNKTKYDVVVTIATTTSYFRRKYTDIEIS